MPETLEEPQIAEHILSDLIVKCPELQGYGQIGAAKVLLEKLGYEALKKYTSMPQAFASKCRENGISIGVLHAAVILEDLLKLIKK